MNLWRMCLGRLVLAIIVFLGATTTLWADVPRNAPPLKDGLQPVLDAIGAHAQREDWKTPGWTDKTIEGWLEKLVATIGANTESAELKLPVKFADVSAGGGGRGLREGMLVVGKDVDVAFAHKSIILADGVAKIAHAQDCIIVARSVVNVSHAQRCVIVAGCFAHVSHDGSRDGGSVVVSRGWADISHSTGSRICASEGITVSHATNSYFINSEVQSDRRGSKSVTIKNLPLEMLTIDPLSRKIEVLGLVQPAGAVFRYEGKRYVADANQPLNDESGKPIESLKGWKLSYIGEGLAVFTSGGADAAVPFRTP